jgi:hypothetical protein
MYDYTRTTTRLTPRVRFDPASKKHREIFAYFLKNRAWTGDVRFYLEWPYLTIPDMCQDKLTRFYLGVPRIAHPWEEDAEELVDNP